MSYDQPQTRKRRSGIRTGNAGEYFVMGELLRRGYDAQLADRNTEGYDLLVGHADTTADMRKVQVKTVRSPRWPVNRVSFEGKAANQVTIYVLVGPERALKPVRYFIAKNRRMAKHVHYPAGWRDHGVLSMKALARYEARPDADQDAGWRRILGNLPRRNRRA